MTRHSRGAGMLPGVGGIVARRVKLEDEIDVLVDRLADEVFAYLDAWRWARVRGASFAGVDRGVACGFR